MMDWDSGIVGVCLLPPPIIGDPFVVYEYQINLPWIRTDCRTVAHIGMFRDATVTPPADSLAILVLVLPQALEYGGWVLKDRRDDLSALLRLTNAPPPHGLHPVVGNQYLARRSGNWIDCGDRDVLTAGMLGFAHDTAQNTQSLPARQGGRGFSAFQMREHWGVCAHGGSGYTVGGWAACPWFAVRRHECPTPHHAQLTTDN